MGDWLPIETAPQDGTAILVWDPGVETMLIASWGKHNHVPLYGWVYGADVIGGEEVDGCEPSHWMPLPEPPPHRERVT